MTKNVDRKVNEWKTEKEGCGKRHTELKVCF